MNTTQSRFKLATRLTLGALMLLLAFGTYSFAQGQRYKSGNEWSFGVMGDTQWTVGEDPTGMNPEYVSAALAGAIQQQFIDSGVKFVIQTGDLTDRAGNEGLKARAEAAQPLYDFGVGFFPIRGNHETYGYMYGRDPDWDLNIPAFRSNFPQTQGMGNTFGANNFSSPDIDELLGLSYSFDYGSQGSNARFVFVDVEETYWKITEAPVDPVYGQSYYYVFWTIFKATADGPTGLPEGTWFRISSSGKPSTNFYGFDTGTVTGYNPNGDYYPLDTWALRAKYDSEETNFWPGAQQEWVSSRLDKSARGTEHAFVFSHRPMMGANHVDGFFGADPSVTPEVQNAFYASLANNDVKYMISAHDHIHNHSAVASPDGLSQVEQLISIGASTKFYEPGPLSDFMGQKDRETQISQETQNVGYYIYTVDGPRVSVDYYSDATGNWPDGDYWPDGDPDAEPDILGSLSLPALNFVKKDSWGYSLNGKRFVIEQGESYKVIQDGFGKTTARILAGSNQSTATDRTPTGYDNNGTPDDPIDDVKLSEPNRPLVKVVNTGWVEDPTGRLRSDILSLWGMADFGTEQTETYVLSMTFDVKGRRNLSQGELGIAALDSQGKWVNAVELNIGTGAKKFVYGPYKAGYGLGTYGIDATTRPVTAWAVVDYNADFAVAEGVKRPGKK